MAELTAMLHVCSAVVYLHASTSASTATPIAAIDLFLLLPCLFIPRGSRRTSLLLRAVSGSLLVLVLSSRHRRVHFCFVKDPSQNHSSTILQRKCGDSRVVVRRVILNVGDPLIKS